MKEPGKRREPGARGARPVAILVALAVALSESIGCSRRTEPPSPEPTSVSATPASSAATAAASAAPAPEEKVTWTTLKEGTGLPVVPRDIVRVHYVGTLTDGTQFDSSRGRKQPFEFLLGHGDVIKGWDRGILYMRLGEKRRLVVPPSLGYGAQERPGIPPNSTLVFEIELVGVTRADVNY